MFCEQNLAFIPIGCVLADWDRYNGRGWCVQVGDSCSHRSANGQRKDRCSGCYVCLL